MQKKSLILTILLLAILAFAIFLRLPTFKLPHDNGDQLIYLGLAMKLDIFGFNGYKLHSIDVKGDNAILGLFPSQDPKGTLLRGLVNSGATYYDEPMYHRSYAFPYMLMFSHRIFAKDKPYLTLNTSGRDKKGRVYSNNADKTWFFQFYAAILPFLFSILFILTTYLLAKRFVTEKAALISTFLISISPIEILCSQKIWADTMLSFFVILTVLLFFLSKEKNNLLLCFMSGITSGIAVLVKQTGGFIIIAILIFHLWQRKSEIFKLDKIQRIVFDKYLLAFALGFLLVTFHWFYSSYQTYATLFHRPPKPGIHLWVQWFMLLAQRPRFLYLVTIPYLVPIFVLVYFSLIVGPFIKGFVDEKKSFLMIWVLTFICILFILASKENRYMLPAYPAIAMLSADLLERIANFVNRKFNKYYGDVLIILILIACAFWSVPIGVNHALANVALILRPF